MNLKSGLTIIVCHTPISTGGEHRPENQGFDGGKFNPTEPNRRTLRQRAGDFKSLRENGGTLGQQTKTQALTNPVNLVGDNA